MSAHTLATPSRLVGPSGPRQRPTAEIVARRPRPAAAPSAAAPAIRTGTVHHTGASMRLLEVGMAVAAIATALLAGIGR